MRLLKYEGKMYELVWLNTDSSLTDGDRMDICIGIAEAYHKKQTRKKIKGKGFEGVITNDGRSYTVGSYSGTKFDVRLETEEGKRNLAALLSERVCV